MSALGVSAAAALDWPRVAERVENWYRVQLRQRYSAT
jgi:hypothetical protein